MASREGSELDELYSAAPESFTAARHEAIERARKAGDAGAVARLKAARKPVVTAWAINQLVRRHASEVDELLEAGDRARAAHGRIVAGGRSPDLRAAAAAVRDAREALVPLASRILGEGTGHAATADQLQRMRRTLEAAAHGSEGFREHFRQGRLVQDLSPPAVFDADGPPMSTTATPVGQQPAASRKKNEPKRKETLPSTRSRQATAPAREKTDAAGKAEQAAERRRIRAEAIDAKKLERAEAAERRQREAEQRRARAEADRERARARLEADRRIAALEKELAQVEAEARRLAAELERARSGRKRLD